METKKYYIKKELILEIEVIQNPDEWNEPDVPINPKDCRIELKYVQDEYMSISLERAIKIDPTLLKVVEDERTRTHEVKGVRIWADGPRSHLYGPSTWGMSEHLLLETESRTETEDRYDSSAHDSDSDNVVPMKEKQRHTLHHIHLPHEIEDATKQRWQDVVDPLNFTRWYPQEERTETDLTDFMEEDEREELKNKQWGILRVIDGGKDD